MNDLTLFFKKIEEVFNGRIEQVDIQSFISVDSLRKIYVDFIFDKNKRFLMRIKGYKNGIKIDT